MQHLCLAKFLYNNSQHATTSVSPLFALHRVYLQIEDYLEALKDKLDIPAAKEHAKALLVLQLELKAR